MHVVTYYRLEDEFDERELRIRLCEFVEIKATACGSWVVPKHLEHWASDLKTAKRHKIAFWTPHDGRRCSQNFESAKRSYLARKRSQEMHGWRAMMTAKAALARSQEIKTASVSDFQTPFALGRPGFIDGFQFEE